MLYTHKQSSGFFYKKKVWVFHYKCKTQNSLYMKHKCSKYLAGHSSTFVLCAIKCVYNDKQTTKTYKMAIQN